MSTGKLNKFFTGCGIAAAATVCLAVLGHVDGRAVEEGGEVRHAAMPGSLEKPALVRQTRPVVDAEIGRKERVGSPPRIADVALPTAAGPEGAAMAIESAPHRGRWLKRTVSSSFSHVSGGFCS